MRQVLFLYFVFLFFPVSDVLSQVGTDEDMASYFDDSGISTSKNLVGLNLGSALVGDIHFTYERKLMDLLSIEVGVGYLLPMYLPELNYLVFSERPFSSIPDGGYSYNVGVNFFYTEFPEDIYNAVNFRQRNYIVGIDWVHFNDIYYSIGIRIAIKRKFIFDYNLGLGYRFVNSENKPSYSLHNGFIIPWAIKFEYLF